MEAAREGAAFGGPPTAAIAALECVRAEGGKAELVDAFSEAVEGLADSEAEAAGAAGEAVELGVELGGFRARRSWIELGKALERKCWVLGMRGLFGVCELRRRRRMAGDWGQEGRRGVRGGTSHDY